MRYILFLLAILQWACAGPAKKSVHQQLTGNWFIIYPEEILTTKQQEAIYARVQDSLVTEKGVKLVSFLENGQFIQWDSTGLQGKWGVIDETNVVVSDGGKGFGNFKSEFSKGEDGIIQLTEFLNIDGERLKISWHLKQVKGGKEAELFDPAKNAWRNKPAGPEPEAAMKQRLSAMLDHYSLYFKLLSENSSYFMPVRVMLPVKFYQHAIGMKDFDEQHRFVSLFYSVEDAKKGYELLKEVVNNSDYNYPDSESKSFSREYAFMLAHLAKEIIK
jgi:hypothetical protein